MVVALLNWKAYCDVLLLSVKKSTTLHEDIVRLSLEVILSPYGASKSRVSQVIGCPILCSTFVWSSCSWFYPNGLWSCPKLIFPTLGENLSITLNYLLSFSSARHACYLTLCNKEDHRGIEKIVEVKG